MAAAASNLWMSMDEFKLFHSMDRELYSILVMELQRDPLLSMQAMALWIWLERIGCKFFIKKILSLPSNVINNLIDESIICLSCITNDQFTNDHQIPILRSVLEKDISLKCLHNHRVCATQKVGKILNEVCFKACGDIMQQAMQNNYNIYGVGADDRTMFVTFSRGFPVYEGEMRQFFTKYYGDCIESLKMQVVDEMNEQALFARIVFRSPVTIPSILNGEDKAKFYINGKHVWARKFVPKTPQASLPYNLFP
ncbi:uncharacterized protein LOC126670392 [Mercurialis annua]|uniref:uncharacterized protein LOC126670392 n=1 Tax=Mercurialis annua TaxID=3986 RepID=UPI00215EAA69|nr:uncharacterized protein LOC126670392 [Mercurialis annua]